ncbi:C-type mannose receptor 2-like [Aricia agestis]|uniref:C-type mannose receptor 2-like n=1 Tax=Aricia agestis TaxID=91739 RepID=UPI001C208245|nr:C-type mannose receptor 2-like [Aricia agestis]
MRVAFLLFIIVAGINGEQFRCDYQHVPSADGWIKYNPIPANWHEARLRCHLEGANLASPLNEGLKAALRSSIPTDNDCGVFTGIHATFSRGDFFSVEGVPLRKIPHKWAMNEPNNFNNEENCLLMTSEGELADVNCTDAYPYLCYKKSSNMLLNECGTVDNEYKLDARIGSCYKFHREPRTWSRAYMTCAAEGGHLAIINSDQEAKVIADIFARNPSNTIPGNFYKEVAFIGFHDWNEHGEWLTIEGQTLEQAGYAKWNKGEPNNKTSNEGTIGQYCGGVTRGALLDDLFCSGNYEDKFVFFCEKRLSSLLCDN